MAFNVFELIKTQGASLFAIGGVILLVGGIFAPYVVCMVLLSLALVCFIVPLFISSEKKERTSEENQERSVADTRDREEELLAVEAVHDPAKDVQKSSLLPLVELKQTQGGPPNQDEHKLTERRSDGPHETKKEFIFFLTVPLTIIRLQLTFLSNKEVAGALRAFSFLYKKREAKEKEGKPEEKNWKSIQASNLSIYIDIVLSQNPKETKSALTDTSHKRSPYEPLLSRVLANEKISDKEDRIALATKLLKDKRELACINRLDKKGRSALWYAAQLNNWKVGEFVEYLISLGADMEHCALVSLPQMEKKGISGRSNPFQNIFGVCKMEPSEVDKARAKFQQDYFTSPDDVFYRIQGINEDPAITTSHKYKCECTTPSSSVLSSYFWREKLPRDESPYKLISDLIDMLPPKFWNLRLAPYVSKLGNSVSITLPSGIIQQFERTERNSLLKKLLSTVMIDLDLDMDPGYKFRNSTLFLDILCEFPPFSPIIYYAITEADADLVKILLEAGANPNKTELLREDKNIPSPLLFAIKFSSGYFTQLGTDLNEYRNIIGHLIRFGGELVGCMTFLNMPFNRNHVSKSRRFFLKIFVKNISRKDINQFIDGYSLLQWAVRWEEMDAIKTLVTKGAEVNLAENSCSATPLHLAAQVNNREIYHFLCKSGADINAKDKEGKKPFDLLNLYSKAMLSLFRPPASNPTSESKGPETEKPLSLI